MFGYGYLVVFLANKIHADQPAHPRSPISAFVIRFLKSVLEIGR